MKEPREQDLFENEKPRKKEKKAIDENALELDFTAHQEEPPKNQEPTPPKNISIEPPSTNLDAVSPLNNEKTPINLAKHLKKKEEEQSQKATLNGPQQISEAQVQSKPQKTLHELKKMAKKDSEHAYNQQEAKQTEIPTENSTKQKTPDTPSQKSKETDDVGPKNFQDKSTQANKSQETVQQQQLKPQPKIIKQSSTVQPPKQKNTSIPQPQSTAKQMPKHIELPEGGSIGHILQEARVKAGFSIDQVAIETRIKKSYIEALERDDLKNLPSATFVNAYIRRLCQQYGIDESIAKKVGKNLKIKNNEPHVPLEVLSEIEKGKQVNEEKKKRLHTFYTILTILIISSISLLILLLVYFHFKTSDKQRNTTLKNKSTAPAVLQLSDEEAEKIMREILVRPPPVPLTELKIPEK